MQSILGSFCGMITRWDPSALFTCWRVVALSLLASEPLGTTGKSERLEIELRKIISGDNRALPLPSCWLDAFCQLCIPGRDQKGLFWGYTGIGIATGEGSQHGTHSGAQFMAYLDRLPLNHEKQLVFPNSLDVQQTWHSFLIQEN